MTIDRRNSPITIRGKTYPSHKAAADDLGTTREAISMAKRRGLLDTVGLRPGESAIDTYIRRLMSDGKWRNANDIIARAESVGMVLTVHGIGRATARLVGDGYLRADGDKEKMWKLRTARREAAE